MAFFGKVALVTGGASGMGRLSAQRLAQEGAKVAALDVNESGLAETAALNSNITTYRCDISNPEDVNAVVKKVTEELGPIDRLTHCAAIMPLQSLSAMPAEKIVQISRINYEGTVYITKAILPDMVARNKGDIILFGSIAGDVPLPFAGAYCASKGAVNAIARQLITENLKNDVRIALVCPPPVNTPLLDANRTGMKFDFESAKKRKLVVEPEVILECVEESLDKGKQVIYPSWVAKAFVLYFRLFPGMYMRETLKNSKPM